MQGLIESTQVFRWQKLRLHIAPEGLLLETRSPLSESGEVEGFAAYENIAAALVEKRGRRATLVIDFHDATEPPWLLPNLPPAEAEWAADLIQRHIQAAERISDPMFTEPLPLAEVGTQALTLLGNQQEQLVDLVDFLLLQAIFHGASDVHLEPFREEVRVRYRINGMLHEVVQLPKHLHGPLLTRLKVVSKLSVFRHDLPQEGRMIARTGGRSVDLRVSSLPTIHGEKVVIRIFDPDRGLFNLDELGFSPQMQAEFERLLAMPQGVILLTGPSNSGKTTTLYAALRHLHATNKSLSSIVTVEDPVEYDLQVINQTQVNLAAGLTFARGLRTVLRQDPEVIMIGEIRDGETAEIAVRAGLTGHLILSTVHARSAPGVFVRLLDLGVEPFLVASAVNAVLAQRLVRTVCLDCAEPDTPGPELLRKFGLREASEGQFLRGTGCNTCHGTGYAGRTGIFELLRVSDWLRELIMHKVPLGELEQLVAQQGLSTLADDGLAKAKAGVTTLEEVARVLGL